MHPGKWAPGGVREHFLRCKAAQLFDVRAHEGPFEVRGPSRPEDVGDGLDERPVAPFTRLEPLTVLEVAGDVAPDGDYARRAVEVDGRRGELHEQRRAVRAPDWNRPLPMSVLRRGEGKLASVRRGILGS